MEFQTYTLDNGLRVIHQYHPSMVAHCGILINAGSRDEYPEEHGIAHLIEHLLFKGTERRKAYQIFNRIEDVGGEINAYTTKELTCVYTSFLKDNYPRVFELLRDVIFSSIYPEQEIQKEKQVILDEINAYKDNPAEQIFDDFEDYLFQPDPIGRNVLGTQQTLESFTKDKIKKFLQRNYHPRFMVLSSIGNISFQRVIYLAEKFFGDVYASPGGRNRRSSSEYTPFRKTLSRSVYQTHCIVGSVAYSLHDSRRMTLALLNNLLGGPGMNARLNLSLREKHGYAYNIESNFTTFTDTGQIGIYFGTDNEYFDKSLKLVYKELERLKTQKLGKLQLRKAKRQLIGQIAISAENKDNLMLVAGKQYLLLNDIYNMAEMQKKIEEVTASDILEVANDIFDTRKLSTLVYQY